MIDTHTHLDALDDAPADVVARARAAGVTRILTVGTDVGGCRRALELADRHEEVFAILGIHPHAANDATDEDVAEVRSLLAFPGFPKLARRHWRTGTGEIARSASRRLTARRLARLVPEITAHDLVPAPAGVRAQALGRDGSLLDDFVIRETPHTIHVVNAPSPAATAALEIGSHVADLAIPRL